MKLSISLAILIAANSFTSAFPTDADWEVLSSEEVFNSDDIEIINLEVTNEAFGDRVFRGTVASIAAEMESLKPGFLDVEASGDGGSLNPLHKRASAQQAKDMRSGFLFSQLWHVFVQQDINAIASECGDTIGGYEGAMDFSTHYIGLSSANY